MYARGTDVESTTLSDDYLVEKSLDPACVQDGDFTVPLSVLFFFLGVITFSVITNA